MSLRTSIEDEDSPMSDKEEWSFPEAFQPQDGDVDYDLHPAFDALVALKAEVPEDAFTASVLGTEREGNGVAIDDGRLVLTIGYLITEAESIWLTTQGGKVVPGYPLAYDFATGFGLVQPLAPLGVRGLSRGTAQALEPGDEVIVVGHGGRSHTLKARLFAKREFAGYWEYVLDEALFTAPAHPEWSGAALLDHDGMLAGIGSLLVQETVGDETVPGNMFVPIDLLAPVLDDLTRFGRRSGPTRGWLGMYVAEDGERLVVNGLAQKGPAARAGVKLGDVVLEIGGRPVGSLANLFRAAWGLGPAGTVVPVTVVRGSSRLQFAVPTADRDAFLRKPSLQ